MDFGFDGFMRLPDINGVALWEENVPLLLARTERGVEVDVNASNVKDLF